MPTITSVHDLQKVYCYDTTALLKAIQSREQFAIIDYDDSIVAVVGLSVEQHLPVADPVSDLEEIDNLYATDPPA